MLIRILRRCVPLLGAASLAAAVFFFWEAGRATPVFSAGGHQMKLPPGDYAPADQALLPTETPVPAYPPPYPPPPTDSAPPYPPPPTDTLVPPTNTTVPPTATRTVPPTATRTVPPTATIVAPPTATPYVPPTSTPVIPPTATRVVPPTSTPVIPPTATPVVLPTSTSVVLPTATPLVPISTAVPCTATSSTYVVQKGDTLFRIALRFGTTANAIRKANGIRGNKITVGQTLTIPVGCRLTPPKPKGNDAEHPSGKDQHKSGSKQPYSGSDQSKKPSTDDNQSVSQWSDAVHRIYYTVRAGDNLFRIGLKYGVSVADLQAANGLHSTYIRVGQVLQIP